jgi:hypothetical protein
MEATPPVAAALLQLGILMGVVLIGNAFAARRLPDETVPLVLRGRITMCNRMRPWLSAAALAMTATGLVLMLS